MSDVLAIGSYALGRWIDPGAGADSVHSAIDGRLIARAGDCGLDYQAILDHARDVGGPALRDMTFHDRARILKSLALYLTQNKQALYELSYETGATLADSRVDIDGGIGTMFVFASKGRREMPDEKVYLDGDIEQLSRSGSFLGQHICTPLLGAAVQINAFNFPVWGMLEKFAPAFLAGVPSIVKPATATGYLTEACVRLMLASDLLPAGSLQFISGRTGDLLDRLGPQDVLSFTGSADTALKLRSNPSLLKNTVRFMAEQDSLNASILGPDAEPGTPEFDMFIKEAQREVTTKAGQKCTAIRRIMVPQDQVAAVSEALAARIGKVKIGDPRLETSRMGALASREQRRDVQEKAQIIEQYARCILGDGPLHVDGADAEAGAFLAPKIFVCDDPDASALVHETEAFGPVTTVMGYRDLDHACELANRGGGSLVASLVTYDPEVARKVALGSAAWHGRLYINNRDSAAEATGHGSPMPHMIHGGPGRAGGGEELGGIRGVKHYMQRTAIQGSPEILRAVGGVWVKGARELDPGAHPFTKRFDALEIGDTLWTEPRSISLDDIEHFAHFTGDTFYAHMDQEAAEANPFFPGRVAHGYLLLSFAAGLFVEPNPGPVLANTGLNWLSFQKPVSPGDSIKIRLVVKRKTKRNEDYGEVRWDVTLYNQDDEQVADYELLTMVAY